MLDLLAVTLLQAVAGAPAEAAAPPPVEAVEPASPEITEAQRRREEWRDRQRCRARSTGSGRLGSPSCATRRSDERAAEAPHETAQNTQSENWAAEP